MRARPFLAPYPVCRPWHLERPSILSFCHLLGRLGLRTLGAVAALPARDMVDRFGPVGRLAHRLASGGDERPPATRPPPQDLAVQAELEPPVQDVGPVAFVAKHPGRRPPRASGHDALVCTRVVALAETEHGERQERVWRHEHGFTAAGIAERVRWQLEGWAAGPRPPTGGISLVRLVPDEVVPDRGHQLGFWGGQTQADERALRAVARLSAQVGLEAVAVPEWRGGRGPGEQLVLVPAATAELAEPAARARRVTPPAAPWPGRLPAPSPAIVLAAPVPGRRARCRRRAPRRQRPRRGQRCAGHARARRPVAARRRLGRSLAGRRALVGRGRAPPPSPLPAPHRRRRGLARAPGSRPLVGRSHV